MLTKPAGCFLQILGVLVGLASLVMLTQPGVPPIIAGTAFVGALVLLYVGGKPARRRQ